MVFFLPSHTEEVVMTWGWLIKFIVIPLFFHDYPMLTIVTVTHMIPTLHHSSQLGARFDLTGATPQRCAAATEPARAAGGAGGVAATCDGGDEVPGDWFNGKIDGKFR